MTVSVVVHREPIRGGPRRDNYNQRCSLELDKATPAFHRSVQPVTPVILDLTHELTLCARIRTEKFDAPIVNQLEDRAPEDYDIRNHPD